jgi:hypothetical protein
VADPTPSPIWLLLISQLGVLALVAAIVTFLLNRRLERLRGRREISTRTFDSARDNVREFASLTSAYWLRGRSDQDPEDEAKIILVQEDVLVDVGAALILALPEDQPLIEVAIDELLRFGTGGDFQGVDRGADIARARRIPGAAARLRHALITARRNLLERRSY